MHDTAPHTPEDAHPIGRQADESNGRIKRPKRSNSSMNNVPRGSDMERREAARGQKV